MLVADAIGPLRTSIGRQRRALIITDVKSNYIWLTTFHRNSEVSQLFIENFRQNELLHETKIKT